MTSTTEPTPSSLRAWLAEHLTPEQRAKIDELWDEWDRRPEPDESVDEILDRNWRETVEDYFGPAVVATPQLTRDVTRFNLALGDAIETFGNVIEALGDAIVALDAIAGEIVE